MLPVKLCQFFHEFAGWFIWHKKEGSAYEDRAKSFQTASGILFFSSFLFGKVLGGMFLLRQMYPEAGYFVPGVFIEAYYAVAATYVAVNQMDLWLENNNRRFRKGERFLLFWPILAMVSAVLHFGSGGAYPFPEELRGVFLWICGLFAVSKISAAFKLKQCKEKLNGESKSGGRET